MARVFFCIVAVQEQPRFGEFNSIVIHACWLKDTLFLASLINCDRVFL